MNMDKFEKAQLRAELQRVIKILEFRDGGDHNVDCRAYSDSDRQCSCGHSSVAKYLRSIGSKGES